MNWSILGMSVFFLFLWSFTLIPLYVIRREWKRLSKKDKTEIKILKIVFVVMAIFIIIFPILFAKVIYHERFRTATGAVSWSRYALPNNGDCDASCKVQCDKGNKGESHYHYIIDSGSTSCDCACVTICKQCLICKNPPDEEVRAWIEGMKK